MSTPAKSLNPDLHNQISKVRVIIRVRPFLSHEISARNGNSATCASLLESESESESGQEVTVHLKDHESSRNECYKLDSFFGQDDNNVSNIFEKEVSPLLPGLFRGCNATVFAYGATGSGKTYTMQGTDQIPGLIPLAMSRVLSLCQNTGSAIQISYYEIYLDKCYDLMELKVKEIPVLEDKGGNIHLKGLAQVPVNTISEFSELFSCGNQRRKVAHTSLNDVSSRSHAVLSVIISIPCDYGSGTVVGKLNLIDLAGNEDNRRTCNEGIRLQESAKINQSLFTLSNVIYALNNKKARVPYRESKLTRILQDSLGGTSRALMVACLNPGEYQESVHTVSLAARSRHVTNILSSANKNATPNVKVDMGAKLSAWLESKSKKKPSAQKAIPFGSPFLCKSQNFLIKSGVHHSSLKQKCNAHQWASSRIERHTDVSCGNLFENGGLADQSLKNMDGPSQENKGITSQTTDDFSESYENATDVLDEPSPVYEKTRTFQSSIRKVLSPIDSNVDNIFSRDQSCLSLFDPKTPKTPFPLDYSSDNSKIIGTPFDKFSVTISNLKSSLVQEYVDVLNKASREELMKLKGIGKKMAEYIVELREESPLKSLNDLEKIGLSSKQVYNMFSRAAGGILQLPVA